MSCVLAFMDNLNIGNINTRYDIGYTMLTIEICLVLIVIVYYSFIILHLIYKSAKASYFRNKNGPV